jgi:hypothetical protein
VNDDDALQDARWRRLAERLGAGAAERLDVERAAQTVVARLRERRDTPFWSRIARQPAWLQIAALVVLVVGAGLLVRGVGPERSPRVAAELPLEEDLGGLTADQLREAITVIDQPLGDEAGASADAELEGLSADELRGLLRALVG